MCIEVDIEALYENQKPPYAREAAERMDEMFQWLGHGTTRQVGSAVSPMISTIYRSSTKWDSKISISPIAPTTPKPSRHTRYLKAWAILPVIMSRHS